MQKWEWKIGGKGETIDLASEVYKTLMAHIEDKDLKVYVASDSQQRGLYTKMVGIVVIRMGNRGCRVFVATENMPRIGRIIPRGERFGKEDFALLRQRLLEEAYTIIQIAKYVEPILVEAENDFFDKTGKMREVLFQTAVDINTEEKWASNKFLKEILGYIKAFGYEALVKPEAMMASNAADFFAKR